MSHSLSVGLNLLKKIKKNCKDKNKIKSIKLQYLKIYLNFFLFVTSEIYLKSIISTPVRHLSGNITD